MLHALRACVACVCCALLRACVHVQAGGAARFNATMLFGDISYAGIDTNFDILNITKADEWE